MIKWLSGLSCAVMGFDSCVVIDFGGCVMFGFNHCEFWLLVDVDDVNMC